ncbi:short chain dehydrogenase family protein [Mycobacterium xenopi 3993]|nr:short chain dehydrogenase family protein [Mycobacterium xenopi 3993]
MGQIDELWRYDGRRAVVTGCSSGIGAQVAHQLAELGADVVGLDLRPPPFDISEFFKLDLADPASIDCAVASIGDRVDSLFNVAGVSSGIGDPLRVVTINFLGLRQLTEAVIPTMPAGSSIVSVSSLAAASYREHQDQVAGLLRTQTMAEGIDWCRAQRNVLADGGYRLSKEAIILYTMKNTVPLGARGVRINCTGPGVTETRYSTSCVMPTVSRISTTSPNRWAAMPNPLNRPRCWCSSTVVPPVTSLAKLYGSTAAISVLPSAATSREEGSRGQLDRIPQSRPPSVQLGTLG